MPGRAGALFAPFGDGWRLVFVPLVIVVHNEHGLALATAGLAMAAMQAGDGLWAYRAVLPGLSGAAQSGTWAGRGALLAGLALLLLGLAPEEGPAGLLLWLIFGLGWPAVRQNLGLAGPWAGAAWLAGMALAGPLALGPGAWLIAAGCLYWAWRLLSDFAAAPSPLPAARPAGGWPALLASMAIFSWIWLAPARLLEAGLPVAGCGAAFALAGLLAWLASRISLLNRPGWAKVANGLAALPMLAWTLKWAAWQLLLLLAVQGLLTGLAMQGDARSAPWRGGPANLAAALGRILGPLAGVALWILAGQQAVFAGAAALMLAAALIPDSLPDTFR